MGGLGDPTAAQPRAMESFRVFLVGCEASDCTADNKTFDEAECGPNEGSESDFRPLFEVMEELSRVFFLKLRPGANVQGQQSKQLFVFR